MEVEYEGVMNGGNRVPGRIKKVELMKQRKRLMGDADAEKLVRGGRGEDQVKKKIERRICDKCDGFRCSGREKNMQIKSLTENKRKQKE